MATQVTAWPREEIPDSDRLFYRVHTNYAPGGVLVPGIFVEHGGSMSTDWGKYSTPEETKQRGRKLDKGEYGVIALVAGEIRSIEELRVEHSPDVANNNRAHTDVIGIESPELKMNDPSAHDIRRTRIREELSKRFCRNNEWLIRPSV